MSVNANITNELARVVGLIANRHQPEYSIQIEWREGMPECEWYVTATNGTDDYVYVVDDESGTFAPMTGDDLVRYENGQSILAEADAQIAAMRNPPTGEVVTATVSDEVAAMREP